jgi:hypothetical protein
MTYPQQPGNWSDPSWPSQQPVAAQDPGYPASAQPAPEGYAAPVYPGYHPYPPPRPTNGMAIAAMVVSLVGVLGLCGYGLGGYIGIVGAILGHVSRRQIRDRGENGDGMALAGIIVGWIAAGIAVLATAAIIVIIILGVNGAFDEPGTTS